MSMLGFLQTACLNFVPYNHEVTRMSLLADNPLMKVRNGRCMRLKCKKRTTDYEKMSPELTIQDIPYVDEVVKRLSQNCDAFRKTDSELLNIEESYERCRMFCAENDKLVFSVSRHLTEERAKALWALFALGRRVDDMIDSPNDDNIRSEYLDYWERRTKDILNGRPHDILDVAVVDTLSKFHLNNTTLIEDGLKGLRMDIKKTRYANFEELFLYCYYVAGVVNLVVVAVLGIAPESTVSTKIIYEGLVYTGIALQLTNILMDVSDDAKLGRVYLPQDELARFGLCDEDIFSKRVTDEWREFIKKQIQRARFYYKLGEQGVSQLDKSSRSKAMAGVMTYRTILDVIEENGYDNLTKKVPESGDGTFISMVF